MSIQSRLAAARLSESAGGNRRGTRRLDYEGAAPRAIRDEQGLSLSGQVQDISRNGIGLVVDRRPERDSLLTVELPSKDELGFLKVVARVSNVRSHLGDRWYVGCLFLRKLNDTELLSLL
jgi:hypothetical protein